jgi:hypothetical protein
MARVFENSAAFFGAPASIREAVSFSGPGGNRGYIRLGGEALGASRTAAGESYFPLATSKPIPRPIPVPVLGSAGRL